MSKEPTPLMNELERGKKAFIVFKGIPSIWLLNEEHSQDFNEMEFAREEAAGIVENTGEDATYMMIPAECLKLAFVLHNHGIVSHTLQEAQKANWPKEND